MKMENFTFKLSEVDGPEGSALASQIATPEGGLYFDNQIRRYLKAAVRRNDAKARNNRTLASVLQEWTEVGYLKGQVSSIANRAGMSTATLYRDFPDKSFLFRQALQFGQAILIEAVSTYPKHPNPIRDLTGMLCNHAETLAHPAPQQMLLAQRLMLLEPDLQSAVSAIAVENHEKLKQVWYAKIQALVDSGWIKLDQIEWQRCRLVGALEARTFGWFMMGHAPRSPAISWEHDAHQVVLDFFRLYGTAKFDEHRRLYNWDWGLP
ncbi:MAG: hypothetical protein CFE27_07610 [Alphaproteobacteria bacterium PA1]|nr:MAG: hypothetical protein CFE27_07610 [Alphaproteobacteria bacterium PA1]